VITAATLYAWHRDLERVLPLVTAMATREDVARPDDWPGPDEIDAEIERLEDVSTQIFEAYVDAVRAEAGPDTSPPPRADDTVRVPPLREVGS